MIFYAHLLTIVLYIPVLFLAILTAFKVYRSNLEFFIKMLHYQLSVSCLFLSLAFISAQYQWVINSRDDQVTSYESMMWIVFDLNLPLALTAFLGIVIHRLRTKI